MMDRDTYDSRDETELAKEGARESASIASEKTSENPEQVAAKEDAADQEMSEKEMSEKVSEKVSARESDEGSDVDAAVDAAALQERIAEIEEAREAALREKDELHDRWLRLQAEFDNFRKRTRKEMETSRAKGAEDVVLKLLPVIDNLERAISSADSAPASGLAEGVRMIHKQFLTVLEGVGVTPIEAVGNPFDPNLHEAVAYEASDEHPEGTVMEDMLRGYIFGEKVLRPSMVKVARGSGNKEETKSDE